MEKIEVIFSKGKSIAESTDKARELYNSSRFGTITSTGHVDLSLLETMYLLEKGTITVFDGRNKEISCETFIRKAGKIQPQFYTRYKVFADLRKRGYIVKTALKFGADFRVYERGVKPGEDHAKWVVFPIEESQSLTWHDFSAKNRVAHSTKKKLLIGIVDDEGDVTYYEVRWIRP